MSGAKTGGGDPFLDPAYGPDTWARVAPTGRRYWPFVLLLALGLSGFSAYWRSQVLPQQALVWQSATEAELRHAIRGRRPVLVLYRLKPAPQIAHSIQDSRTKESPDPQLAAMLARLDVPQVRVATRLQAALLFQVEEDVDQDSGTGRETGLAGWMFPAGLPTESGLLGWDGRAEQWFFFPADEVSPEQVGSWLNRDKARHAE